MSNLEPPSFAIFVILFTQLQKVVGLDKKLYKKTQKKLTLALSSSDFVFFVLGVGGPSQSPVFLIKKRHMMTINKLFRPGAIPNPESESKDESGFDSGFGIMCSGIGFGLRIV